MRSLDFLPDLGDDLLFQFEIFGHFYKAPLFRPRLGRLKENRPCASAQGRQKNMSNLHASAGGTRPLSKGPLPVATLFPKHEQYYNRCRHIFNCAGR
jgi:hypothetical protein